jgi:beta-lactamase class A
MKRRPECAACLGGIGGLLAILAASAALAQDPNEEDRLKQAGEALLPHFNAAPRETFRERFTPSFLRDVGADKLEAALKDLFKSHGKATAVRLIRLIGPFEAEMDFLFEKGVRVPSTMRLEAKPPHRIIGFQLHGAYKDNDTLGELIAEFRTLPGKAAFTFMKLSPDARTIWEHNATETLAVGSCFKLLLLAALADDIEQNKRQWQDITKLRAELISLPSGIMQDWPLGAPVTLHTLATLMISKSDNTAADHLFHVLGRPALEEIQKKFGVTDPKRNRPFLSAGEFFRIKHVLGSEEQKHYLEADLEARRRFLDSAVKHTKLAQPRLPTTPEHIDKVEWLFMTTELCRLVDWLRQREKAGQVREILSVGRGMPLDREYWPYIGYKFGYEPGVACFVLLLQDRGGAWFALVTTWNDPEKDVDYARLLVLTQRLVRLAQRQQVK